MKLILDIPSEFICDYKNNSFAEFFNRAYCDLDYLKHLGSSVCGNYEFETLRMLRVAFYTAKVVNDD